MGLCFVLSMGFRVGVSKMSNVGNEVGSCGGSVVDMGLLVGRLVGFSVGSCGGSVVDTGLLVGRLVGFSVGLLVG